MRLGWSPRTISRCQLLGRRVRVSRLGVGVTPTDQVSSLPQRRCNEITDVGGDGSPDPPCSGLVLRCCTIYDND